MRTGDPPGSFFILHFWEKISMSEKWLRLLPFIFFVVGIITLIRISILLKLPPVISVAMGYLPLASAQSVYHSIELRAYAMELGMTYLAIYVSIKMFQYISCDKTINIKSWLLFTAVLALGVSSRFSFIVTTSACYGTLLFCMVYY